MTRESTNQLDPTTGYLLNGYDYDNQAWVVDGKYEACGHPADMDCGCYSREHEGQDCVTDGGT